MISPVFIPAALVKLWPEFTSHRSRPCCGDLAFNCICGEHRINLPICTGPHGGNESSGIKRWLAPGMHGAWESLSVTPSVHLHEYCGWHGFITNGEVR